MQDPIPAEVDGIQGDDVFRVVVADVLVDAKFSVDGFLRREEIGDLDVDAFVLPIADEVDFLCTGLADGDAVAAAQEFQADDIFECLVDGIGALPVDRGA